MREQYIELNFQKKTREMIAVCDGIVQEYSAKGFKMTIRQLYYQMVARGFIPNSVQSYDNIQNMMNNARLAGIVDWDAIEDRTRDVISRSHWTGVKSMLQSAANWYHEDMWAEQPHFIIALLEKEALAGVFEHVLNPLDIPLLPARGYISSTSLRELAKQRMLRTRRQVLVLHFGDHDPSGMDMSRDLRERLEMFTHNMDFEFRRMALTLEQVAENNPPPFPAKITDSRYRAYVDEYGHDSWELDALTPEYLKGVVEGAVHPLIDWDQWNATEQRIERRRTILEKMADEYDPNDETEPEEPDDAE